MPSVLEQIQLYRIYKADQPAEADTETVPADTSRMIHRHPKTADFFTMLMQRWQSDYMKKRNSSDPAS